MTPLNFRPPENLDFNTCQQAASWHYMELHLLFPQECGDLGQNIDIAYAVGVIETRGINECYNTIFVGIEVT